jgi:hypothetical protein
MFQGDPEAANKAGAIADWLSSHEAFKSHGRHIPRTQLEQHGLRIEPLEGDQTTQDLVLSIFHATMHTFNATPAVKIIESHHGKCWVKLATVQQVVMQQPQPQPAQPPQPAPQQIPPPPPPPANP